MSAASINPPAADLRSGAEAARCLLVEFSELDNVLLPGMVAGADDSTEWDFPSARSKLEALLAKASSESAAPEYRCGVLRALTVYLVGAANGCVYRTEARFTDTALKDYAAALSATAATGGAAPAPRVADDGHTAAEAPPDAAVDPCEVDAIRDMLNCWLLSLPEGNEIGLDEAEPLQVALASITHDVELLQTALDHPLNVVYARGLLNVAENSLWNFIGETNKACPTKAQLIAMVSRAQLFLARAAQPPGGD